MRLVREPPCALELTEKLEQLRALYLGARIAVLRTERVGVGVDTPEDVGYLEAELRTPGLARGAAAGGRSTEGGRGTHGS